MIGPRVFTDQAYYLPKKKLDLSKCILIMLDKEANQVYQVSLESLKELLIVEEDHV